MSHRVTSEAVQPHPGAATALAAAATALILGLMLLTFTVRNRAVVFLYDHDMGPRVPHTGPFSPVTRSRYWMTGLVVAGAVLAATTPIHLLLGRLQRAYCPPAWHRVWLLCAGPLLVGIPLITMTTHSPTLPLGLAALTTGTTLIGLALALIPGRVIATHPLDAALLGLDGLALALWLLVLPGLQYLTEWIAQGRRLWIGMLAAAPAIGLIGLGALSLPRIWWRRPMPSARELSLAALIVAYVALPFLHYTVGTNGYFYITNMDNFFSRDLAVQAFTYLATGTVIAVVTRLRHRHAAPVRRTTCTPPTAGGAH
jgi:hypothetical protein